MKVVQIKTEKGELFFTDILPSDAVLRVLMERGCQFKVVEISEKDYRANAATETAREFFAMAARSGSLRAGRCSGAGGGSPAAEKPS